MKFTNDVVVLSARRYSMVDDKTGELVQGCKVQYIIDAFNAEYDSTTGSFGGFDSISVTLDSDFFSTFDRETFALKKYTYAKVVSGSDLYIFSVALSGSTFRATYQVNGGDAQIYDKTLNSQESSIYSPRWVSLYPNKYDSGLVWIYAELNYLHGVNEAMLCQLGELPGIA